MSAYLGPSILMESKNDDWERQRNYSFRQTRPPRTTNTETSVNYYPQRPASIRTPTSNVFVGRYSSVEMTLIPLVSIIFTHCSRQISVDDCRLGWHASLRPTTNSKYKEIFALRHGRSTSFAIDESVHSLSHCSNLFRVLFSNAFS